MQKISMEFDGMLKSTKSCSLLNINIISVVSKSNKTSEKTLCPFLSAGFICTENSEYSQGSFTINHCNSWKKWM